MSIVLFVLMGVDKAKAIRGTWRISEKVLFLCALSGGAPGGLIGMVSFHHKTKHRYFVIGFTVLATAQIIALVWLNIKTM